MKSSCRNRFVSFYVGRWPNRGRICRDVGADHHRLSGGHHLGGNPGQHDIQQRRRFARRSQLGGCRIVASGQSS